MLRVQLSFYKEPSKILESQFKNRLLQSLVLCVKVQAAFFAMFKGTVSQDFRLIVF
jgi:hypothetical protein